MTAAQPDYAETVRLLPGDTFTQQTRDEWVAAVAESLFRLDHGGWAPDAVWPDDCGDADDYRNDAAAVVRALLAHLAAQQARPMPGGDPT